MVDYMYLGLIRKGYQRDFEKLKNEINLYKDEYALWIVDKGITTSAGHLCLLLIDDLNHFIGVGLGKTKYERNRELEFILDEVPRAILIYDINTTMIIVDNALKSITSKQLKAEYSNSKFEYPTSVEFVFIHLLMHLNYHIGQINYHRRFLDN